ncbi:MAG: RluA family pseudouridine synthase [Bacteroidota bacterium]|nr:RluA family pseudouridine synthase [Bacteroidota bacterium]
MNELEINESEGADEELFEHHKFVVDKGQSLIRIDKFITDKIQNATRNKVQNAIDANLILVNNKPVKANYRIKPADVISIFLTSPPRNEEILGENIPLNIVYEDDELAVINKPPGMVVHPAYGNWTGTLVNALVYHFDNLPSSRNGSIRPGLIHRIDKDTSGLMVIAKSEIAMTHIAKQFFDHSTDRVYHALVWGELKKTEGTIQTLLGRSPYDRKIVTVVEDPEKGKNAITHYKVLQSYQMVTLVECRLETGRTHQIRAHMKHLGHPLFNDASYGGDKIHKGQVTSRYKSFIDKCFEIMPRQALHAKTLGFEHPTLQKRLFFNSELPQDFAAVLNEWNQFAI